MKQKSTVINRPAASRHSIHPPLPVPALLALLSVKSPSSCLTLLREHDRHPCHWKCLQQSDAPNLSSGQVNLWIIYFYVLPDDVDSSRHVHHARPVCGGAGPAAPTVTVNERAGWVLGASSSSPPGPGPRHHQGPIRNTMTDLTLNRTGLPLVPFGQEATSQARPAGGRGDGAPPHAGGQSLFPGPHFTNTGGRREIHTWLDPCLLAPPAPSGRYPQDKHWPQI